MVNLVIEIIVYYLLGIKVKVCFVNYEAGYDKDNYTDSYKDCWRCTDEL